MRRKRIDLKPVLSSAISAILGSFSKSRTLPKALVQRSAIILMSAAGKTDREIASEAGLHYNQVGLWRNRFLAGLPALQSLEAGGGDALSDGLRGMLSDKPRPGAPPTITPGQVLRIVDIARKPPGDYGYEASHWSYSLLADAVVATGIADTISRSSVYRFLKSGRYPPPQSKVLAELI